MKLGIVIAKRKTIFRTCVNSLALLCMKVFRLSDYSFKLCKSYGNSKT